MSTEPPCCSALLGSAMLHKTPPTARCLTVEIIPKETGHHKVTSLQWRKWNGIWNKAHRPSTNPVYLKKWEVWEPPILQWRVAMLLNATISIDLVSATKLLYIKKNWETWMNKEKITIGEL